MARYSASQHLRFRIKELWETKGSKKDFEDFYQEKMDEIISKVKDDIFKFQTGNDFGLEPENEVDDKIKEIEEIFGIDRKQNYPL